MASCPGPSTVYTAQVTVITETTTRFETAPVRRTLVVRDPWRPADVRATTTPAPVQKFQPSNGWLIPRQGSSTLDLPATVSSLIDSISQTSSTERPSSTSISTSAVQPSSQSTSTSESSVVPPASQSSSSNISSTTTILTTNTIVETVVRTITSSTPVSTVTPSCTTSAAPETNPAIPAPSRQALSTYTDATTTALLSSVIITTVVTSGTSLATVVTSVPTLISFEKEPQNSSMPAGAIAGIVIGTVVVFALMIGFACVFHRRRKKQRNVKEMTERMTVGRMLESEGFDDGMDDPFQPPRPSYPYGSYHYGMVGSSPTRADTMPMSASLQSPLSPYSHDLSPSGSGVDLGSMNPAASMRAFAAKASGSSTGSIFREHFDAGADERPAPSTSLPSPAFRSRDPTSASSVHEPLIGGHHGKYSSMSSDGTAQRSQSPSSLHQPSLSYGSVRGKEPPSSYLPPHSPPHDPALRGVTYPVIAPASPWSSKYARSSSSLPPGAAIPKDPHSQMDYTRYDPGVHRSPPTPKFSSSPLSSQVFLPDTSDYARQPRTLDQNAPDDASTGQHAIPNRSDSTHSTH